MKAVRVTVRHLLVQAMFAILWVGGAGSASSIPLYVQPAQFALGGPASQNAPNSFGALYTAFDNFTLTTDALITDVDWQGSYINPAVQGTITQFEIIFWSDNAGLPGQVLQTYTILGTAGEHFVASNPFALAYSYTTHLPTPFAAGAHTTYWLSIQPTVDFPPQWHWREGTGGDGRAAQIVRSVSPAPLPSPADLAFALMGVPGPVAPVSIDIKPGSFPNSINPRSRGKIPVAILTTATFDATTVDPTTVLFGQTGTEAAPVHAALQDVDGDGDTDLILHFNTQETGILCGDISASLTGKTFSERTIEDSDPINTVGCK
jgi:hypothetical protein